MFDNNFGYFGNGIEGYAHYMQSFNNNFSNDDNGFVWVNGYQGKPSYTMMIYAMKMIISRKMCNILIKSL